MHPNDPLYAQQWHLTRLGNIEKIWDEYSGAGVHVGVYDTGVETRIRISPPTTTRACTSPSQACCRAARSIPSLQTDPTARGHGTAVAGIIGAPANKAKAASAIAWGAGLTSVNIAE